MPGSPPSRWWSVAYLRNPSWTARCGCDGWPWPCSSPPELPIFSMATMRESGTSIRVRPDARSDRRQALGSVLPADAGGGKQYSWLDAVGRHRDPVREILVSGLREYLAVLRVSVPVTKLAKWKTTIQLVAIGFLIAGEAGEEILPSTTLIGIVLLWMSAIFTSTPAGLFPRRHPSPHRGG